MKKLPIQTLILTSLPILCVLIASAWYWYTVIYPAPPDLSCGSIKQAAGRVMQNTPQAESCFVQAFQLCQARTLTYSSMGVDTFAQYELWPTLGMTNCLVQGKLDSHVNTRQMTTYFTCKAVQATPDGLLISRCNNATSDILIPNR